MKKLNTDILFQLLINWLHPKIVCDVGSLDAKHSMKFRRILPDSRIVAFEANPHNFEKITNDPKFSKSDIELHHKAVSSENGRIKFHIESVPNSKDQNWRHGCSSILSRTVDSLGTTEIELDSTRIDNLLSNTTDGTDIALWIDVEGAAYEVLVGMRGIRNKVGIVHVEVETLEVWEGQKLRKDVDKLMDEYGFIGIARGKFDEQHDIIYLPKHFVSTSGKKLKFLINTAVAITYIRKWFGREIGWLLLTVFVPRLLLK